MGRKILTMEISGGHLFWKLTNTSELSMFYLVSWARGKFWNIFGLPFAEQYRHCILYPIRLHCSFAWLCLMFRQLRQANDALKRTLFAVLLPKCDFLGFSFDLVVSFHFSICSRVPLVVRCAKTKGPFWANFRLAWANWRTKRKGRKNSTETGTFAASYIVWL